MLYSLKIAGMLFEACRLILRVLNLLLDISNDASLAACMASASSLAMLRYRTYINSLAHDHRAAHPRMLIFHVLSDAKFAGWKKRQR